MALLSNYSYLMRKANGESTFTKLVDITNVPDLGGAPETIDVTTLSDMVQRNILGIQTASSHEFSAWYEPDVYDTLYAIMLADRAKKQSELDTYQVWIGENGVFGKFEWQGKLSVFVASYDVNTAIPMTITISDEGVDEIHKVDDGPTPPPVTTYTVTQTLTNVTSTEVSPKTVNSGDAFNATLTADSGYTIDSVTVTMGVTDITSTAWNSGTGAISIASVTGNVVITASATT